MKSGLLVLVVMLGYLRPTDLFKSATGSEQSNQATFNTADAAYRAKDWAKAAEAYEDIVRREPANGRAWYLLGRSLHFAGKYDRAAAAFERTVENRFALHNSMFNAVCGYSLSKNKRKAFHWLKRLLTKGYSQPNQLTQEADLAYLREDVRFADFLAAARDNAAPESCRPAWSPDGAKIAFDSDRNGDFEIYVMSPDGSKVTSLTDNSMWDGHPSWSPDGSKVVFSSGERGTRDIHVMNADGSNRVRLTDRLGNAHYPHWSPDGSKIVFNADMDGDREIFVVNADGSNATQLTKNEAHDDLPKWSSRGDKIYFDSDREGSWTVFMMNPDGSNQTRVTSGAAPVFSRDGTKLAYQDNSIPGAVSIMVMNADGSGQIKLTNDEANSYVPSWSPDNSKVAFCSTRTGRPEVYVMRADGSKQTRLTGEGANGVNPRAKRGNCLKRIFPNRSGSRGNLPSGLKYSALLSGSRPYGGL